MWALMFFVGDMLFYGHRGSGTRFHGELVRTVTNGAAWLGPWPRVYASWDSGMCIGMSGLRTNAWGG